MFVHRRGHGDDINVAVGEVGDIGRIFQRLGGAQFLFVEFAGGVAPFPERGDPGFADVEAYDRAVLGKFDRQGQADISQTDYRQLQFGNRSHDAQTQKKVETSTLPRALSARRFRRSLARSQRKFTPAFVRGPSPKSASGCVNSLFEPVMFGADCGHWRRTRFFWQGTWSQGGIRSVQELGLHP